MTDSNFEFKPFKIDNLPTSSRSEFRIINNSSPEINEGSIANLYATQSEELPQLLPSSAFELSPDTPAQAINDDMDLRGGMDSFFSKEKERESTPKTYFIVDAGLPHLPGLCSMLLDRTVDPAFVVTEKPRHDRFQQTLKYWSNSIKSGRDKLPEDELKGIATLIDCHRETLADRSHFPTLDALKKLGIERVVYLSESPVGEYNSGIFPHDVAELIAEASEEGLEIESFGIDTRQGFRNSS